MSEITLYEAQAKKMQGICDEHNLTYRFLKDRYPIIFIIRPIQGMDAQISMLEAVEEAGYISPEAEMMWSFKDGALETRVTGGTFTISKTLRTKIESILMKMITYWQQYFFKDVLEKHSLAAGMMPVISEEEAADDEYEEDAEGINEEAEAEMDDVNELEDADDELGDTADNSGAADDDLYDQAVSIVRMENKATVSLLQRRLNVGYARAARIMELLEENGIVGPYAGSNPREVLPADEPDDMEDAADE